MANGAPRGDHMKQPQPTREQQAALDALLKQASEAPPFFELVEVRQFNTSLIQISEDQFALTFDTPAGRRYGFPMPREVLNKMSEMFTRAKLGVPPAGGPPMPAPGAQG